MRMSENEGAETPKTKDAARAEFFKEEANVYFKSTSTCGIDVSHVIFNIHRTVTCILN